MTIGQVPYDLLREHLPADTRYMTLVREPVDRVLSHYYRRIHRTGTPLDERRPVIADSLEDALQMRLPHITNLATRFLCGEPSPSGELPGSALDQAKANLREFEVVGIDEQLDESIVLLQRAVGLGLIPYEDLRVSSDGPARLDSAPPTAGEIPDEQRDLIVEHNQLDVELYAFAQGLFEDAVSAGNEGLAADAERLRALSEAATEEALQDAREWLDRELPPGGTKALSELRARARADGISLTAFRHEAPQRLAVESHLDDDGQWIWTRVAEK